jgi:hypothetical protein
MRHKWTNAFGLQYDFNETKSVCENCGLVRLRMTFLKSEPSVVYYHPTLPKLTTYKAPKCKSL